MRCFPTAQEETLYQNSLPKGPEIFGDREAFRRSVAQEDARNVLAAERCEREAGTAGRHVSRENEEKRSRG